MAKLTVCAELELPTARVQLAQFNHGGRNEYRFRQHDLFWIDACLTPRRPNECARYVDHWGPHRFSPMGSIIMLPPGHAIHLKSEGGHRTSLICQLRAEAVHKCLPEDFAFSDRRLEACLDVSNTTIQNLLLRLARELQNPGVKSAVLAEAISVQLAIEAARYLIAVSDDAVTGGLASWRLRVIDKRLTQEGPSPTLPELAALCNLSVRQLTRAFRTSRGSSIGDFMAQSRIEMAKRRLMSEGCVKAVANSMGFSSQSTFTYAFRRATGVTPGQFRTHALRADESPISSLRA